MKLVLLAASLLFISLSPLPLQEYRITGYAQGTSYHITYYATHSLVAKARIDSILDKIDSSLSLYKPYSLINQFNSAADGLIVDDHFTNVINKALTVYQQTGGLFDITVYPLTAAWGFGPQKPDSLPDSARIRQLLPCVSSALLYWEGKKLMKRKPCVKLDANGIAQGYSVDILADLLEKYNIQNYIVELGGELRVKGRKLNQEKMSIGIESPGDDIAPAPLRKVIWIEKGAITTSGNYRKYYESRGQKISHLLNPKTGYPLQNELISVTVYAKDAMTADAWDNALMGMGLDAAMDAIEKKTGMAAYFIYRKSDGTVADTASKKFTAYFKL